MRHNYWMGLGLLLAACNPKLYPQQQQYLPPVVDEYYFGMSLRDFRNHNAEARPADEGSTFSFRQVWVEEAVPTPYSSVVYYFDNEGERPLYEIIINYHRAEDRDVWVAKKLGPPNHENGKEWLFDSGQGFQLNAWTFKNKLVIAAAIPGCEWDENRDGIIDPAVN